MHIAKYQKIFKEAKDMEMFEEDKSSKNTESETGSNSEVSI